MSSSAPIGESPPKNEQLQTQLDQQWTTIAQTQNSIEPDDVADDGYETDPQSHESTSLSSSVRDFVFENNRRYHRYKEGAYLLPNDEPEQEREDMKHAMVVHVCDGKLHFAPLTQPHRILDIGTGTGIWALDSM